MKVKLNNGNVASRILPVRIHDLEKDDTALFESYIGSVMRPVDFVYKTAGVNRPLRQHEEHPDENQNHINYLDQINKLANTIKEIISGLSRKGQIRSEVSVENQSTKSNIFLKNHSGPATKKRLSLLSAIVIFFPLISYSIFYLTFQRGDPRSIKDKLAIKI